MLPLVPILTSLLATTAASSDPGAITPAHEAARASLEAGLERFEQNDFPGAVELLEAARGPFSLEQALRREQGLGVALAYAGQAARAEQVFTRLLAIAPGYALPYTISPKATFVFERARKQMSTLRSTEVRLELPPVVPFDAPVQVRAVCLANALELVRRWQLCHRVKSGSAPYACQDFEAAADAPAELSLPAVPAAAALPDDEGAGAHATLQLAVSGFDELGNEVYRGPSRQRPQEISIGGELAPPWYENVWLWSSIGVGAVAITGGVIAAALLLQPTSARVVGEVVE